MDSFENRKVEFDKIENIDSLCCVLGLKFPEVATEFQKAFLTLAHLTASCRDFILGGRDVPLSLLDVASELMFIIEDNRDCQR